MPDFQVTPPQLARFIEDGYLLVPQLFDAEEMELLSRIARLDRQLAASATTRQDLAGGATTLAVSNELGDDIYSSFVLCRRLVDAMEIFLGGEVYHYHHKMMLKEPRVGGAWEWHQDYGYWYHNGCLFPWMGSAMIAVDRANRDNGCLQVIRGSHQMGRVEHGKAGGQTGADLERVEAALARMELVYVESQPGDTLFFHGNLLHRSDQNRSEYPRWSLICCYNAARNDPYKESKHPRYRPLDKQPDASIKQVGRRQLAHLLAAAE